MVCGFFGSSSTQAGYRLTFSIEGNAVEKVVRWLGDVGRSVEVGTLKELTRRNIVKHEISNFIIAYSNIKGYLKPKGMLVYEWCRY